MVMVLVLVLVLGGARVLVLTAFLVLVAAVNSAMFSFLSRY